MDDTTTHQELIEAAITNRLLDVHTALPGEVLSYDRAKQTADVQIMVQRAMPKSDDSVRVETLKPLPNVPVWWPGGDDEWVLAFPVSKGASCLVIFSEAAWTQWRQTGQISQPGDLRRHDYSYACALVGLRPSTRARTVPAAGALLAVGGAGGGLTVATEAGASSAQAVVLVEKLKAALAQAVNTAAGSTIPGSGTDGGKAALLGLAAAITAMTAADLASPSLKAGS